MNGCSVVLYGVDTENVWLIDIYILDWLTHSLFILLLILSNGVVISPGLGFKKDFKIYDFLPAIEEPILEPPVSRRWGVIPYRVFFSSLFSWLIIWRTPISTSLLFSFCCISGMLDPMQFDLSTEYWGSTTNNQKKPCRIYQFVEVYPPVHPTSSMVFKVNSGPGMA